MSARSTVVDRTQLGGGQCPVQYDPNLGRKWPVRSPQAVGGRVRYAGQHSQEILSVQQTLTRTTIFFLSKERHYLSSCPRMRKTQSSSGSVFRYSLLSVFSQSVNTAGRGDMPNVGWERQQGRPWREQLSHSSSYSPLLPVMKVGLNLSLQ